MSVVTPRGHSTRVTSPNRCDSEVAKELKSSPEGRGRDQGCLQNRVRKDEVVRH